MVNLFSKWVALLQARVCAFPVPCRFQDYGRGFRAQQWLGLKRMTAFSNKAVS